jgi:hypothetical protein
MSSSKSGASSPLIAPVRRPGCSGDAKRGGELANRGESFAHALPTYAARRYDFGRIVTPALLVTIAG